jgi:hypothetical protein
MSLSEGGGEPSIHPFHPLRALARGFLAGRALGDAEHPGCALSISSSSGVRGRLDDAREREEDTEGSGVVIGLGGLIGGGGVTDTER